MAIENGLLYALLAAGIIGVLYEIASIVSIAIFG